jgi:hypothetical protein
MSGDEYNIYSLDIGNTRVHISLENGVWMIEATCRLRQRPAVVLGLGCGLVVTRSPMAAAQIAKLCTPKPVPPLQWVSYW